MTLTDTNKTFVASCLFSRSGLSLLLTPNSAIFLLTICLLTACTGMRSPSREQLASLENPPEEVIHKLDILTPLALKWVAKIEQQYLATGRELSDSELQMATSVGVTHPEKVRIIVLKDFPYPENKVLLSHAKNYGLGIPSEGGRTMGNIIMLKAQHKDERWLLARELAHVAQQEKMGRDAYVRRFITEHEIVGRHRAPLELEAKRVAMDFD